MATRKTLASLSFVALLAASVSAEPVYVNSVAALTNAVATATDGATIVLRATGEPYMFTDEWMDASGTVKSMLKINASNITIEGEDSSSRKTWTTGSEPVIIDANGLGRIVQVVSKRTGVTFKNITFTGGNASGDYGGGMNGSDDKTLPVCTNCVFRGNTATKQGSAVFYCNLPEVLGQVEMPVFGTFLDGTDIYKEELSQQGIIVMGNEGNGISQPVAKLVNRRLYVPNYPKGSLTTESLNVAVATGIVCAEFRRR